MKKFLLLLILILIPSTASAADFSSMNPTVKITSYKYLFNGQVQAYGSGSGTVLTSDGLVLTNNHVIFDEDEFRPLDAFEVCITFNFSEEPDCTYTASLLHNDRDIDLALLKIEGVSGLKFLEASASVDPKEGDKIQVVGYPGSGGDTITITQGQISGFESYSNHKYFKTDSDIDHGNSGGTALDSLGRFIGIPTYIRSYAENVGYFLDVREAVPFIEKNKGNAKQLNAAANKQLIANLKRLDSAKKSLKYTSDIYPRFSLALPSDWRFNEINDDSVYVEQKKNSGQVAVSFYVHTYPYEIDDGFLKKLDEQLAYLKENYPDYKKTEITFAGQQGFEISYTSYNRKNTSVYIPLGYTILGLSYGVDLDDTAAQKEAIDSVLNSLVILDKPVQDPKLPALFTHPRPAFSMKAAGPFRLQPYHGTESSSLIAEGVEKKNYDGQFEIHYMPVPKNEADLSEKDRLEDTTKYLNQSGSKVVYKFDSVILDGLPGHLYINEYESDKYQEIHKKLTVILRDGEYQFEITYDDLAEAFDRNIEHVRAMLDSFTYENKSADKGKHEYGSLGSQFSDIQFHRFSSAISDLAQNGIIQGFSDGTFRPESNVTRAEALKMILESKNKVEEKKNRGKHVDFEGYASEKSAFKDIKKEAWFSKYTAYAAEKKLAEGFAGNVFKPGQSVTLAEGLKWVLTIYEIPLWSGDTHPWSKKYMDKAYELGLLPRGLENPNQVLTRAELSYLISTLFNDAKR
jgi:hypothetical protein